jgi:hypothetical protein
MTIVRTVFQGLYGKGGELAAAQTAAAKQFIAEMGGDHNLAWVESGHPSTGASGAFEACVSSTFRRTT